MYGLLKELLPSVPSVSGREQGIREIIQAKMAPLCDRVEVDAMGNLLCFKKGKSAAPRCVLLAAHMDEIGFMCRSCIQNTDTQRYFNKI